MNPKPSLIGNLTRSLQDFFRLEAASGIVLFLCAAAAFAWANLCRPGSYQAVFDHPFLLGLGNAIVRFTVRDLVNDGLMTVFFSVVGMEIKREIAVGELGTPSRAMLPAVAALGGMLVPAALYLVFNWGTSGQRGWGIPMATDIAFCIGVLTLLRRRVPYGLIVFVTALAIFDDIGGIAVIALFYGHGLSTGWLAVSLTVVLILVALGRSHVRSGSAYAVAGGALWFAFHQSGIHPAIAGVVLGLAIPARPRQPPRETLAQLAGWASVLLRSPRGEGVNSEEVGRFQRTVRHLESPLDGFVRRLHPFVAFGIMPLFALANSGVVIRGMDTPQLLGPVAVGTAVALVVGKALGIFVFTAATVSLGLAPMPGQASFATLLGVSTVAGIGFTVAIFIAGLAFPEHPGLLDQAKVGILGGSLVAGLAGALWLRLRSDATPVPQPQCRDRAENDGGPDPIGTLGHTDRNTLRG
jgi:Na+:H+ antiporter, NhaA family